MSGSTANETPERRRREAYESAKRDLARAFREARSAGDRVRLGKPTSNLFRARRPAGERRLDVAAFDAVISVDARERTADVGGMTPYDAFVAATLPRGLMPAVVPELKSITVGGAVTGGGIESSSFRYGFVHETVREMDVLTAEGEVILCRPDNAHSDLFYGFANSYGTLGYALRLRVELIPAAPAVRLTHRRYADPETYYADLESFCRTERRRAGGAPFVDGVVFGAGDMRRSVGEWAEDASDAGERPFERRPYYRALQTRSTDKLKTEDYLWRWDADWFWCARAFGMERPAIRRLVGFFGGLNSRTYWKLRHLYDRSPLLQRFGPGRSKEWVIQDVEIPAANAPDFHAFLRDRIGVLPFWVCPAMAYEDSSRYPLYPTDPDTLYINFGFWGGAPKAEDPAYHNRLVEAKVAELGGMKSLYSESFFSEADFWRRYNGPAYRALKARYDPEGFFPDLYEKAVLGL